MVSVQRTGTDRSGRGLGCDREQSDDMLESKPGSRDVDSGDSGRSTVRRRRGLSADRNSGDCGVSGNEASALRARGVRDLVQSERRDCWAWLVEVGVWWQKVGVPVLLLAGGTAVSILFTASNIRADQKYMQEVFLTMSEAVAKGTFDALSAGIRETSMATAVERIEWLLGPYLAMEDFDKLAEGFIAYNGKVCSARSVVFILLFVFLTDGAVDLAHFQTGSQCTVEVFSSSGRPWFFFLPG